MEFEVRFRQTKGQTGVTRDQGEPVRILLLGDFSGRLAHRPSHQGADVTADPDDAGYRDTLPSGTIATEAAVRPLLWVDIDNFDDVMRRAAPRLWVAAGDGTEQDVDIAFESLDDFHPDSLCRKLPALQALCELRRRIIDPRTSAETVHALAAATANAGAAGPASPDDVAHSPAASEDAQSTFKRLLGTSGVAASAPTSLVVDELVRRAVAPHVVPASHPKQAEFAQSVEKALSTHLCRVLHDPSFQRLEAAWRAAHWFITNAGPDEELKVALLDIAKEELAADLEGAPAPTGSWLHRRMTGAGPWSLVVSDYTFDTSEGDSALMGRVSALAGALGASFLAAATPELAGFRAAPAGSRPEPVSADASAARRWQLVRERSEASYLGLVWPRFLLRAPYGAKTDRIETFAFEEGNASLAHQSFLWGNASFAAAAVIATALRDEEEGLTSTRPIEIDDLPLYAFEQGGQAQLLPCAQLWLDQNGAEAVLSRGIMPLLSLRDRNSVRFLRFQSIAEPPAPLSGTSR